MQNYSRVAAVIGGNITKILTFFEKDVPDIRNNKILQEGYMLDRFQLMRFENDLMLFGKFFNYILWSESFRELWNTLKERACQAELSYVFYRLEQVVNYVEYEANRSAHYFDSRLLYLYDFDIKGNHTKLQSLAVS